MNALRGLQALLRRFCASEVQTAKSSAAEQDHVCSEADDTQTTGFSIYVADNYHYMDESETYVKDGYATWDAALDEARRIVIRSVREVYEPGMTADVLYERYVMFGEDPAVVPMPTGKHFSAWDFARERCEALTGQRTTPGEE